jgi:peptidoglycan-associated lipoprotein
MSKKLWLVVGLLALFTGCGQQPELDVDADKNDTVAKQEQPIQQEEKKEKEQIVETDLSDTTEVKVTEDSLKEEEIEKYNQNLAKMLSQNSIYFDFDKYEIKANQLEVIQKVANLLKESTTNFTVRIEGNCDEWGSDEYNYALGLKRAKVVKQALIDLGVDENKLTIISYGESNPVCTTHTKDCWAKNRRDNFTLLP